jgi:hypothetical protein
MFGPWVRRNTFLMDVFPGNKNLWPVSPGKHSSLQAVSTRIKRECNLDFSMGPGLLAGKPKLEVISVFQTSQALPTL